MTERLGTIQGPQDIGTGKRIGNAVVTLPAGTVLTNADGTITTLANDTPVFLQRVVIGDSETLASASVSGESGRGAMAIRLDGDAGKLASIEETLKRIEDLLEMTLEG